MTSVKEIYNADFQKVFSKVEASCRSLGALRDFLNLHKTEGEKSLAQVVSEHHKHELDLLFPALNKYFQCPITTVFSTDKLDNYHLYHPVVVWYAGLVSDLCVRYRKNTLDEEGIGESEDNEVRHTTFTNGALVDNVVDFETIIMMIFDSLMFKESDTEQTIKPILAHIIDCAKVVRSIQEYLDDSEREDDDDISTECRRQENEVARMRKHVYLLLDAIMRTDLFISSQKINTDLALNHRTLHPSTPDRNLPFSVVDLPSVEQAKKMEIAEKKRVFKEKEEARKREYAERQLKIPQQNLERAKRDFAGKSVPPKNKKMKIVPGK